MAGFNSLLAGLLIAAAGTASPMTFNEDGFPLIDGTPRLLLGLYEMPTDERALAAAAKAGFNLVRIQDVASLDRLHKQDLFGWHCLSVALQLDDAKGRERLIKTVNMFKDHPAFLVWELPDEALWNVWHRRELWVHSGQRRALAGEIDKMVAKLSADRVAELRAILKNSSDFNARGLWEQSEEASDRLWNELGVKNPKPNARFSTCRRDSLELADAMERGCRELRNVDSRHPIWLNHAPRNSLSSLARFSAMGDATGCDIYPAPFSAARHGDLNDVTLASVGSYTRRMREAAAGRSVWMVLQGFGWRDIQESYRKALDPNKGRRPTMGETRFMAFDAIVRGANAVLYWGTASIEKDSQLWNDLLSIAAELRSLEPAIVGKRPDVPPQALADESYGSIDPTNGPVLMLRRVGDEWTLLAVNENDQRVSFTVMGLPSMLNGKLLYRLDADEKVQVQSGQFHDGIRAFGVHVYSTRRQP